MIKSKLYTTKKGGLKTMDYQALWMRLRNELYSLEKQNVHSIDPVTVVSIMDLLVAQEMALSNQLRVHKMDGGQYSKFIPDKDNGNGI